MMIWRRGSFHQTNEAWQSYTSGQCYPYGCGGLGERGGLGAGMETRIGASHLPVIRYFLSPPLATKPAIKLGSGRTGRGGETKCVVGVPVKLLMHVPPNVLKTPGD